MSPEDTRQRIVMAAERVLTRDGYSAASVKDIAAEAGVAPGLVHYYFHSKEELVVAAVKEACDTFPYPATGDPVRDARDAFELAKSPPAEERRFNALFLEMLGPALHNDGVRAALAEWVRIYRDQIEEAARTVIAQREDWAPERAPHLASAVWGAIFGIRLQATLDPSFDTAGAIDALAEMALR